MTKGCDVDTVYVGYDIERLYNKTSEILGFISFLNDAFISRTNLYTKLGPRVMY